MRNRPKESKKKIVSGIMSPTDKFKARPTKMKNLLNFYNPNKPANLLSSLESRS